MNYKFLIKTKGIKMNQEQLGSFTKESKEKNKLTPIDPILVAIIKAKEVLQDAQIVMYDFDKYDIRDIKPGAEYLSPGKYVTVNLSVFIPIENKTNNDLGKL